MPKNSSSNHASRIHRQLSEARVRVNVLKRKLTEEENKNLALELEIKQLQKNKNKQLNKTEQQNELLREMLGHIFPDHEALVKKMKKLNQAQRTSLLACEKKKFDDDSNKKIQELENKIEIEISLKKKLIANASKKFRAQKKIIKDLERRLQAERVKKSDHLIPEIALKADAMLDDLLVMLEHK